MNGDGAFRKDTGYFTAPVRGHYFFSFNGLMMAADYSKSSRLNVQLMKIGVSNGVHNYLAGAMVDTSFTTEVDSSGRKKTFLPVSMQATVSLQKGDMVGVTLNSGWLHEPQTGGAACMTTFTGFLVQSEI